MNDKEYIDMLLTENRKLKEKDVAQFVLCNGWKGFRHTRYKCPACNKILRKDGVYCSVCGQKIKFPRTVLKDGRIELDWSE